MKKFIVILLSQLLLFLSLTSVSADENHIILGTSNSNILTYEECNLLNEDLNNVQSEFGLNFIFIYDSAIKDDEIIEESQNYLLNNSSAYGIVLCINDNYYTFAITDNLKDILEDKEDQLFDIYATEETYYDGILKCYQEALKIVNSNFYESKTLIVEGKPEIYDAANLLTSDELQDIKEKLSAVSAKYDMDVIVLLADSLNYMSARNFADDYYDYNGYKNDGILFMLSMSEREWYVSTKGRAINIISDNTIDTIVDYILGDLTEGNYYKALNNYADRIDKAINYGINHDGADYHEKNIGQILGISALISSIAALIVFLILNSQLKSVKAKKFANDYIVKDSFVLTGYSDFFLRKEASKTARQSSSSSGSHSSHTSSSGSSHGGHGGRF